MKPCMTGMCLCGFWVPETLKALRLLLHRCLGTPHVTLHLGAGKLAVGECFGVCGLTGLLRCDCLCDCADLRFSEY